MQAGQGIEVKRHCENVCELEIVAASVDQKTTRQSIISKILLKSDVLYSA